MEGLEQNVVQLSAIGISPEQAGQLLVAYNNNLELAASNFFELGGFEPALQAAPNAQTRPVTRWDSSLHTADRYGHPDTSGSTGPSFNIDYGTGVNNYPHSGFASANPTRPNSPVAQSIEGLPAYNSAPTFGPATRPEHETKNWALAVVSSEQFPDPPPSRRQRGEDEPAFIKPLLSGDGLPAFLTIACQIPKLRDILLAHGVTQNDYRVTEDWWNGEEGPVAALSFSEEDKKDAEDKEFLFETQRLMAFLQGTTRAYGSIGALCNLESFKEPLPDGDNDDCNVRKFLERWDRFYSYHTSKDADTDATSPHTVSDPLVGSVFVDNNGKTKTRYLLDLTARRHHKDLEDVLDDFCLEETFRKPCDVLVMRVKNEDYQAVGIETRAILDVGLYHETNKSAFEQWRKNRQTAIRMYEETAKELAKRRTHRTKAGNTVEVLTLLTTSMSAFAPDADGNFQKAQHADTYAKLNKIYEETKAEIDRLESQLKEFDGMREKSDTRYRAPKAHVNSGSEKMAIDSGDSLTDEKFNIETFDHSYTLCGVALQPNMFYVLDQAKEVAEPEGWWRIEYVQGNEPQVYIGKASIFDVKTAISGYVPDDKDKHSSALLVYASPAAMACVPTLPSDALMDFVREDNKRFHAELEEEKKNMGTWADYNEPQNIEPIGGWDTQEYNQDYVDWDTAAKTGATAYQAAGNGTAAKQGYYHQQQFPGGGDEDTSSFTLTPGTETGEEMQEVGVLQRNSSSSTPVDEILLDDADNAATHIEDVGAGPAKGQAKYGSNNPYLRFQNQGG